MGRVESSQVQAAIQKDCCRLGFSWGLIVTMFASTAYLAASLLKCT